MDRNEIIQEIWGILDQMSDDDLVRAKGALEALLQGDEGEGPAEAEDPGKGAFDAANPTVLNLAEELKVPPEIFLSTLGEYERALLTSYFEDQDSGMLINLRKALGLPSFPMR